MQLAAVHRVFAGIGNIAVGNIGDFLIAHVDAVTVDYRAAVVDGQAVGRQVGVGGDGDFFAGVGNADVVTVFEVHSFTGTDFFGSAAVGLEVPAGIGGAVDVTDGIVNGGLAGAADIVVGVAAGIRIIGGIAANDVFHTVTVLMQLTAVNRVFAGGGNIAIGNVGYLLISRIDTGLGYARAAVDGQAVVIERAVAGFHAVNIHIAVQADLNAVTVGFGGDVAVAGNADLVAQFFHTGIAAITLEGQTFVINGIGSISAFFDVVFNFVCQSDFVAGNVGGGIGSSRYHGLVIHTAGLAAFGIDGVGVGGSIVVN